MTRVTAKSSTIYVTTRDGLRVFQSMQDVPETYRRRLQACVRDGNSVKLLIADKRGREELMRALGSVQLEAGSIARPPGPQTCPRPEYRGLSLRTWVELLLPAVLGASLWLFIGSKF